MGEAASCLQGFVRESSRSIVIEGKTPAEVIDKLIAYNRKRVMQLSQSLKCLRQEPLHHGLW